MITYGNGEVLFDGYAKGFEIRYKGVINITNSPDNLFLSANKNKIMGFMLDGTDMPQELFNYIGELRILSCKSVQGNSLERERITLQGVDYWELDREKWEDDGSLWGTRDGTYLVGSKQRFNKHSIVVNNNIRFNSDLRTFEDVDFNFKYLRYVNTLVFVNDPLYRLSIHTDYFSATMRLVETPESLFGYREALRQAQKFLNEKQVEKSFEVTLLKAYVTYSIIQLIRLSIQQCSTNKQSILKFVNKLLQDPMLQQGLAVYTPKTGDSLIIPWLMRLGFSKVLVYICKRRGNKRYATQ